MDIQQIQYIIAIVESGSMNAAAEKMFVSQSAISLSYKKLEQELGISIFTKRGRKLELTEAGRVFYQKAKAVEQAFQDLQNSMHEIISEREQTVLVCSEAVDYTNEAIKIYSRLCPDVFFQQVRGSTEEIKAMLNSGAANFAITLSPDFGSNTTATLLLEEPMLLIAPANKGYEENIPVSISELKRERLITLREGLAINNLFRSFFATDTERTNHVIEVNDPETIVIQVSSGFGISFIPESAANMNIRANSPIISDVCIHALEETCRRQVYLVAVKGRPLKKTSQNFVDFLIKFGAYTEKNKCFPKYEDIEELQLGKE